MSIISVVDLGDTVQSFIVDHDPTSVSTDAPIGSLIYSTSTNDWYMKDDNGDTTNVTVISDATYTHPNHTGDVTSVGDGAQTIAASAVTNAKMADMATLTMKGNDTGGATAPQDLTVAEVQTLLNIEDGAVALPVVDTTAVVKGSVDATKLVRIEADGITTATTRVITMPDKDITLNEGVDHIQGGADEVDGDQLDIDFTPSNYSPSTAPGEVDDVDQLSAHLAGIDDALATAGSITASVDTTDATLTTIATIALTDDTVYFIEAILTARQTNAANRAIYRRLGCFYREAAGGATRQGNLRSPVTIESNGLWDFQVNTSANNVLLQVQGVAAANVSWEVEYKITPQATT
jgi:hypothetical protein